MMNNTKYVKFKKNEQLIGGKFVQNYTLYFDNFIKNTVSKKNMVMDLLFEKGNKLPIGVEKYSAFLYGETPGSIGEIGRIKNEITNDNQYREIKLVGDKQGDIVKIMGPGDLDKAKAHISKAINNFIVYVQYKEVVDNMVSEMLVNNKKESMIKDIEFLKPQVGNPYTLDKLSYNNLMINIDATYDQINKIIDNVNNNFTYNGMQYGDIEKPISNAKEWAEIIRILIWTMTQLKIIIENEKKKLTCGFIKHANSKCGECNDKNCCGTPCSFKPKFSSTKGTCGYKA